MNSSPLRPSCPACSLTLLLVCAVLSINVCLAEEKSPPVPNEGRTAASSQYLLLTNGKGLSLADAVAAALAMNPRLKSAQKDYLNAAADTRVAGLTTSFSVGTSGGLTRTPDESTRSGRIFGDITYRNFLGTQASLSVAPFASGEERGSIGLTLRHPLMRRSGILSEKSDQLLTARSQAAIADREMYLQRQATVQGVIESYYRAVQAQKQVKVQEEALAIAEKTAEIARRREEYGLDLGIDVVRAESEVAATRDALNMQIETARGRMDQLMIEIGAGVGQTPDLTDDLPEVPDQDIGLGEAIRRALENRSEFAIYAEQIATQQRKLAIASEELKPALEIAARFNSSERDSNVLSASVFREGYFDAALVYRFPLEKRAAIETRNNEARELDNLARLRAFQVERVVEQVRSAYREMEAARASLDINTRNVKVTEERLRLAERMVEEGLGTNREVLDAQSALTQAKSGAIAARTNLYLAMVNLRYYMGEDLTKLVGK